MDEKPYSPKAPRNRKPSGGPEPFAKWIESNPIRQTRLKAGLTIEALAAMIRSSERTVRKIEKGTCRESSLLAAIARTLGNPDLPDAWLRWRKRKPSAADVREAAVVNG
jgi:DNA-binding XRE family transcriptional regulator